MGQVALPEMRKYGYSGALATGTLAGRGYAGHPGATVDPAMRCWQATTPSEHPIGDPEIMSDLNASARRHFKFHPRRCRYKFAGAC
jgi:hypothetical protein